MPPPGRRRPPLLPFPQDLFQRQQVQDLGHPLQVVPPHVGVQQRRAQRGMPQDFLDRQQVHPRFEEFCGKRVAKRVRAGDEKVSGTVY